MEFWGIEVKAEEPVEVTPKCGQFVHLTHAALGETTANDVKEASISLITGDKHMVIGFLKPEEKTQMSFDLVFGKKFVLTHDWKNGSLFFAGKQAPLLPFCPVPPAAEDGSDEDMEPDSSDEGLQSLGDDSEEDESDEEGPAESSAPLAKKAKAVTPGKKTGNNKGQNAAAPSKAEPKSGGSGGGKKGKRG